MSNALCSLKLGTHLSESLAVMIKTIDMHVNDVLFTVISELLAVGRLEICTLLVFLIYSEHCLMSRLKLN